MGHPRRHAQLCVAKSEEVSELRPKLGIVECFEYIQYENNVFSIVFCGFGQDHRDSQKSGPENEFGFDLASKLAKFGARWDQIVAKLGPSWDKLGQVGAKLGQVGGKRGRILDRMVEHGGQDGQDRPRWSKMELKRAKIGQHD